MAKILIVDDSPTEIYLFTKILARHGHEVISAETGKKGIALAVEEQPSLVLMDIVMPEMNGFQATRQLRTGQRTKHIPVIIVSVKDQESDRLWAKRQGASSYLTKPIQEAQLVDTVNGTLGG